MSAEDAENVCGDPFPHLRLDFETCTKPCILQTGHRPESPHRCDDGHEWFIDTDAFIAGMRSKEK